MAEPPRSPPPFWRTPAFWVTVAALLIANWVLGSLFLAPPSRLQVPYTEFQSQLTAGNVESVTSKGETIQGEFHNLAHTLLDHETLDEADAYRAAGFPAPTSPIRNLDTTPVDR
jgi:hypothetical protein